jgi:hypothetical protein
VDGVEGYDFDAPVSMCRQGTRKVSQREIFVELRPNQGDRQIFLVRHDHEYPTRNGAAALCYVAMVGAIFTAVAFFPFRIGRNCNRGIFADNLGSLPAPSRKQRLP